MWGGAYGIFIVAALCVLGVLASVVLGAPIVAIPIALIGAALFAIVDFRRRQGQAKDMGEFREQAQAEKVDFTERDKETLVSE